MADDIPQLVQARVIAPMWFGPASPGSPPVRNRRGAIVWIPPSLIEKGSRSLELIDEGVVAETKPKRGRSA